MADEAPAEGWSWHPPGWLKAIYDWGKIAGMIAATAGLVASYFVGKESSTLIGVLSGVAFIVLFASCVFVSKNLQAFTEAQAMLQKTAYTNVDERQRVSQALGLSQKVNVGVMIALTLVTFISLVFALQSPVYHLLWTSKPQKIEFADLRYFMPSRDASLLGKDSFLEALIGSLRDEGTAEGKSFRIALGHTRPFAHPTPQFRCTMSVEGGNFLVTGYAFRKHRIGGRSVYEELPRTFPRDNEVAFSVPQGEHGDELFVLLRISLAEGGEFPENIKNASTLRPIE